ncbi:MAG: arsenate reductase ArsC, partial [Planctomycetes bacterium]|nr:arsenate reductase ArsC [Planctomycetota bacterium]
LFLCTGNSCRSQMAEGWARHLKGDVMKAYSAGLEPKGLHPLAGGSGRGHLRAEVQPLAEVKSIRFDFVVTVCDRANERCPVFPVRTKRLHVSFEDPAKAQGAEEEVLAVFRKVRDQIRAFVETLPQVLEETKDER